MRKTLLLLALCIPLFLATYQEGQRVYDLYAHPVSNQTVAAPKAGPEEEAEREELTQKKTEAETIVNLPERAVLAGVRTDGAEDADEAIEPKALTEPVLDLARSVAKARGKVEELRLKCATSERRIEELRRLLEGDDHEPRDRPDVLKDLAAQVKEYQTLEVHNPDIVLAANAEIEWVRLRKEHPPGGLDQLYKRLDRWSPGARLKDDPGSVAGIKSHVEALQTFLDKFGSNKIPLAAKAKEQLALWMQGERLLAVVKPAEVASPLDQLLALAAIAQEDGAPAADRFVATARKLTRALCADYLKPEGLDPQVLVQTDQNEPERVLRKNVRIRWKKDVTEPLVASGFDEYTLPRDEVDHLNIVNKGTRELPRDRSIAPLKGTPYSDAVRAFNERLKTIKDWSEDDLSKLRTACEPHREALARGEPGSGGASLLERIDKLLELASRHPKLFLVSIP